jgi:hypothetical protein
MSGATLDIYDSLHITTKASLLQDRTEGLVQQIVSGDWLAALRHGDSVAQMFSALIADVAQEAYDAGASKAQIARTLDVPVSTFSGMKRS